MFPASGAVSIIWHVTRYFSEDVRKNEQNPSRRWLLVISYRLVAFANAASNLGSAI